jgi:SAM-dependent methyltransferase
MATLRTLLKVSLPARWHAPVGRWARRVMGLGFARHCPVCRSHLRRFLPAGTPPRADALCPICHALERHRLVWLYFRRRTDLFDGRPKRMLHVAPERPLAERLAKLAFLDYRSGDLDSPAARERIDVTAIPYPDDSFDVIYCSHVLEHVPEDRKAMAELCRVLRPGGWAVLQVPINGATTFEDWSVQTAAERERVFGQWDHVRIYGADYKDRLAAAGFVVRVDPFVRQLDARVIAYLGLDRDEDIYFCEKPAAPAGGWGKAESDP